MSALGQKQTFGRSRRGHEMRDSMIGFRTNRSEMTKARQILLLIRKQMLTSASRTQHMICSVVYRFRAMSSFPQKCSEIAGFAQ
jgi:hypothetical protein